ncbi:hypothetical protein [Pseudomonas phage Itty13]|jgi:hypothetical protein|uniref:Uncharacterized protein n=1 Tax=Pseudomonas phage Itty13 TaxID=2805750 RepID=A0A889IQM4_9CAUD|nr:hypothetical protein PQC19_gp51 [Pseudomonas phage Itty13]QRE00627.1 hypothetical protein [Pseudomonas phage Itty13]
MRRHSRDWYLEKIRLAQAKAIYEGIPYVLLALPRGEVVVMPDGKKFGGKLLERFHP